MLLDRISLFGIGVKRQPECDSVGVIVGKDWPIMISEVQAHFRVLRLAFRQPHGLVTCVNKASLLCEIRSVLRSQAYQLVKRWRLGAHLYRHEWPDRCLGVAEE